MVKNLSIIIPVYRNAEALPTLVSQLSALANSARSSRQAEIEVVFVVDGNPDDSHAVLSKALVNAPFASQLLLHTRNFGSFAAIRSGLKAAEGDYYAVIAADLQEPTELALQFLKKLEQNQFDVVVGSRKNRDDPLGTRLASLIFWRLYKQFVVKDIPENGVDVFGCNQVFRDQLLSFNEANSSMVGQIFWLGFRRTEVIYDRAERLHGKSAWTLRKKVDYMFDSIFSFTDLPVRMLTFFGLFGLLISVILGSVVLTAKLIGGIEVPGYTATVLIVIFFSGLNSLGLGVVGNYAWRAFENTKGRPLSLVMEVQRFYGRKN